MTVQADPIWSRYYIGVGNWPDAHLTHGDDAMSAAEINNNRCPDCNQPAIEYRCDECQRLFEIEERGQAYPDRYADGPHEDPLNEPDGFETFTAAAMAAIDEMVVNDHAGDADDARVTIERRADGRFHVVSESASEGWRIDWTSETTEHPYDIRSLGNRVVGRFRQTFGRHVDLVARFERETGRATFSFTEERSDVRWDVVFFQNPDERFDHVRVMEVRSQSPIDSSPIMIMLRYEETSHQRCEDLMLHTLMRLQIDGFHATIDFLDEEARRNTALRSNLIIGQGGL